MFTSVLVANRGEIAVRICKTLRTMGVRSVVVASIPDRRSLAVRTADDWVLLEGYSAAESYLDVEAVIAAAKEQGCEAIHPGYGFLSERADFAERCAAEGIVFVGPPPEVLRGLGDKSAARRLAVENGVPVVPGWDGADDDATLLAQAMEIGLPVMIKARGGGGGRGMRPVYDPSELPEAIESGRREAEAAFGDPGLLLEKLITNAHHVEVQIVADSHGNVIHLGERDCSVQRRRQKLIEETPSPVVDDALRAELTAAALKLARAVGYVNAGTFEFLVGALTPEPPLPASAERGSNVGASRPFFFLEVNPRLQVEHPVTEMVTGLDLVELQLRVAAGEELPLRQEDVTFTGHAIEFRINAEDPWNDFRPSSGRITDTSVTLRWGKDGFLSEESRDDEGYELGDVVPTQYDSLILKRVVRGFSRDEALAEAEACLGGHIAGVATNRDLHLAVIRSGHFRGGNASIDWLEPNLQSLLEALLPPTEWWAAAALGLSLSYNEFFPRSRESPFSRQAGWIGPRGHILWLTEGSVTREVRVQLAGPGSAVVCVDDREFDCGWIPVPLGGLRVGGVPVDISIGYHNLSSVDVTDGSGKMAKFDIAPPPPLPRRPHAAAEGATAVVAPLAGTIATVRVAEGDVVEAGDLLLTLDAMKMEHRITATAGGTIAALQVAPGDVVREGDLLVEVA